MAIDNAHWEGTERPTSVHCFVLLVENWFLVPRDVGQRSPEIIKIDSLLILWTLEWRISVFWECLGVGSIIFRKEFCSQTRQLKKIYLENVNTLCGRIQASAGGRLRGPNLVMIFCKHFSRSDLVGKRTNSSVCLRDQKILSVNRHRHVPVWSDCLF